jgi:hypothetical protein
MYYLILTQVFLIIHIFHLLHIPINFFLHENNEEPFEVILSLNPQLNIIQYFEIQNRDN